MAEQKEHIVHSQRHRKLMISMLTKGLASQKQRTAQDDRMLELLSQDESYVSPDNIAEVLKWYREEQL